MYTLHLFVIDEFKLKYGWHLAGRLNSSSSSDYELIYGLYTLIVTDEFKLKYVWHLAGRPLNSV